MKRVAIIGFALALGAAAAPPGTISERRHAHAVSGDGFVLVASYDQSNRSGDLVRLDPGATKPAWSAAERLPAPSERHIFTSIETGSGTDAVEFVHGAVPGLDRDLIDYLRGDRRREGKGMRVRAGALGDIVGSAPVIVGPPSPGIQVEGYDSFRARNAQRRPLAYVGANDGMLHAFDVATGIERFAYIPRALHSALPELARPDYKHRPYVDAPPGAGEANTGLAWRTVLASGFGMGHHGLFAIDITNPDRFASGAGELWQFTSDDDSHMEYVHAEPAIAKFRMGTRNGEPRYRYFVTVPSGGALFLLALDKPERERWRKGSNYYRLEAREAGGLGPMAVIPGPDGSVHYVYAGDLQGQLWRFDFTGSAPWKNAVSLLFTAIDGEGHRQPISTAPRVVFAPTGGHLVLFGTSGSGGTQSLYAIHDPLGRRSTSASTRKSLTRRYLKESGNGYRLSGSEVEFGRDSGWYIDFAKSESITSTPQAEGGVLVVSTREPFSDVVRTYVLSAVTGMTYADEAVTGIALNGSMAAPPLLVHSGTASATPDATGRTRAVRRYSFVPMVPGGEAPPSVEIVLPGRRLSWREIPNWDDLHRAATEGGNP